MRDDLQIDLIDVDPTVFGSDASTTVEPPRVRRRWLVPMAVLSAAAVAAGALLVWQPWQRESEPPMSNRLALGSQPFNEVESVEIDAPWDGESAAEVGFVYADRDATLPRLRGGEGRSLYWVAYAADSAPPRPTQLVNADTVLGTPVAVIDEFDGINLEVGPIDGRRFRVTAHGLAREEIDAIVEQLAVVDGEPVLRDDRVLLGMEPIGSLASMDTAVAMAGGDLPVARRPYTEVVYVEGDGRVSIASVTDADGEVEQLLQLLLGDRSARTIDGRTRLTADVRDLGDGRVQTLVAWRERGRLIVVGGPGGADATGELADTVVELPEAQWAQIAGQAAPPGAGGYQRRLGSVGAFPATIGFVTVGFDGYGEIVAMPNAMTDRSLTGWALCLSTDVGTDCVQSPIVDELPSISVHSIHGREILLAIAPPGSHEPMLRVTRGDAVELHLLFRPGGERTLPGPAVAIADDGDITKLELLVDGVVVVATS